MSWHSPEDAMPWVGLYAGVASLVCTLAMAVDAFQGLRKMKLWFPCRFFTINAATLTLIAIAMKLPVDLTTDMSAYYDHHAKTVSMFFLVTMLANFLPSLGLMNDKELLTNVIALCILIITIMVNVFIQSSTHSPFVCSNDAILLIFTLLWPFSVALMVPTARRILEYQYVELHKLTSNHQERKFPSNELERNVKKYWMMTETGNPQFVIACSPICSASGVICSYLVLNSLVILAVLSKDFNDRHKLRSDYKWSIPIIWVMQLIGIVVGSIAPVFRCVTAFRSFNFSAKWSINHLNVFRVEKHWTQRLRQWKHSYIRSHIPGRHCKQFFHNVKNIILNFCIALQIIVVVICKIMRLVPSFLVIIFSCCCYFCKSFLRRIKDESTASSDKVRSEMEEYTSYVLQVEEEEKLSKGILRNTLKSVTRLLHDSEKKEPRKLMKLLEKSTGFNGVTEYDNDEVPPLHPDETPNCWSLVMVTLTAIAIAIPNITNGHIKVLLSSMGEGLQYVWHIEESLNANDDLVNARKAARSVWTEVEVSCKWLQVDLKKAHKGKKSQEILQWLGDEAIKVVIQFKRSKSRPLGSKFLKFIAAISMYRMSRTILLHCSEQEDWPSDEEIFDWISTMIADILWACFTNLPRIISIKCHESAIEKREMSIRTAAQILGKTKKILNTLQERELPAMDLNSMAYIDEWHALVKSQNPSHSSSSSMIQPASSTSNESLVITVV